METLDWARRLGLSGKYLAAVAETLNSAPKYTGYLQHVGKLWLAVPKPENVQPLADSTSAGRLLNTNLPFLIAHSSVVHYPLR